MRTMSLYLLFHEVCYNKRDTTVCSASIHTHAFTAGIIDFKDKRQYYSWIYAEMHKHAFINTFFAPFPATHVDTDISDVHTRTHHVPDRSEPLIKSTSLKFLLLWENMTPRRHHT